MRKGGGISKHLKDFPLYLLFQYPPQPPILRGGIVADDKIVPVAESKLKCSYFPSTMSSSMQPQRRPRRRVAINSRKDTNKMPSSRAKCLLADKQANVIFALARLPPLSRDNFSVGAVSGRAEVAVHST